MLKKTLQILKQPSAKWSLGALLSLGILLGVSGVLGFNATMHATNTEEFCTSCHAMRDNPLMMLQDTAHYHNKSGVRPTCSDCHVPQEFIPKMIRKIEASREVWGAITGIIDTPEKYAAHVDKMKAREIARLKANDSQECRNCHNTDMMLLNVQTAKAQEFHQAAKSNGKTCIDCHAGIAHTPADQIEAAETRL